MAWPSPPEAPVTRALHPSSVSAMRATRSRGDRPRRLLGGKTRVEHDFHVVAHLERAHEGGERLDSPLALDERDRALNLAVGGHVELEAHRARGSAHLDVAVHRHAAGSVQGDARGAEADRLALEDLLVDVLLDVFPVLVAQGLGPAGSVDDPQRGRVGVELHGALRVVVHGDSRVPTGHVYDEVVASLLCHTGAVCLHVQRAVVRAYVVRSSFHGRAAYIERALRVGPVPWN